MSFRRNNFPPVCTPDEARALFEEKGLTYRDISEGDILALVLMLNEELKHSNKAGETSAPMRLCSFMRLKFKPEGILVYCHLYVVSDYFEKRECISFNKDGFIGFAGWADDMNLNPILRAFRRWCDALIPFERI